MRVWPILKAAAANAFVMLGLKSSLKRKNKRIYNAGLNQ